MRRCAVAKASCSRLRSIKAPPCFDARITSKRVCALPHPRDPPDVSAPNGNRRFGTADYYYRAKCSRNERKKKGKREKGKVGRHTSRRRCFRRERLRIFNWQRCATEIDRRWSTLGIYSIVSLRCRWFVRGEGRYWSRTDGWCRFDDSWRTTIPRVNINRTLPLNRDGYSRRQFAFNYGKYCRTPAVHCQYIPSDRSEYCLLIIIISVNIVERN